MRLLLFNLATDVEDPILGFTTRWIAALAQRVAFIHVITMRTGRVDLPGNVRLYSVGKEKGYSEPRRALVFYRQLYRVLCEDRIDVCFSHMITIFAILASPFLRMRGIPIVTWYAHPHLAWTLKLAHHLSDRVVSSVATAYPYKHDKLAVVGQGIDTNLFCHDERVVPDTPPVVLCVGRLSPSKGHLTLLRAASLLRRRSGGPFRLVMLGGPSGSRDEAYVQLLRDEIENLEMHDIAHLEPAVPMVELPYWYRRCTVHVNLTPTGFGDKVAWEAMACGRPCIAANEGFRDTLGDYADQLLYRYGDPEDLARRLEWTLSLDHDARRRIGGYLRNQVIRMHSLDGLADRLTRIFAECVA